MVAAADVVGVVDDDTVAVVIDEKRSWEPAAAGLAGL
jgi:hypothetical protein